MCQLYSEYYILKTHLHKNVFQNLTTPQSFDNDFRVCIFSLHLFILYLFSAAHYISHTYFYFILPNCFLASKLHSAFQSTACSVVLNDWLHWVTMHFWPGWESLHNPRKNLPCRLFILCFSTCLAVNMPRSSKLFLMTSRAESCH